MPLAVDVTSALHAVLAEAPTDGFAAWLNSALLWVLDLVQSVNPVLRTVLAGVGIMLETSVLIGLGYPRSPRPFVTSRHRGGAAHYSYRAVLTKSLHVAVTSPHLFLGGEGW